MDGRHSSPPAGLGGFVAAPPHGQLDTIGSGPSSRSRRLYGMFKGVGIPMAAQNA